MNVHSTKHEVRFNDARLIHGLITSAFNEILSQEDSISTYYDKKIDLNRNFISIKSKSHRIKDTDNTFSEKINHQNLQ